MDSLQGSCLQLRKNLKIYGLILLNHHFEIHVLNWLRLIQYVIFDMYRRRRRDLT